MAILSKLLRKNQPPHSSPEQTIPVIETIKMQDFIVCYVQKQNREVNGFAKKIWLHQKKFL